MIATDPVDGDPEEWLARARKDEKEQGRQVDRASSCVRRALAARRVASADSAGVGSMSGGIAAIRLGYGSGDALVDGRYERAIDLPLDTGRRSRAEMLRPQERFAAILSGREVPLVCEELILRARSDLEAGAARESALQVRIGLEALLAERDRLSGTAQADDLAFLDSRRRVTGDAANEALRGALSAERAAETKETLEICERILRRRAAQGT